MNILLNEVLMKNDVEKNTDFLVEVIPEIAPMVKFSKTHSQYDFDLWRHTLMVLKNLDSDDLEVKMAALLHDVGRPYSSYESSGMKIFMEPAQESANIAAKILERLEYEESFINDVCYLIKTCDEIINVTRLDNSYEMVIKRLNLQYADAKSHHPDYAQKRLNVLDVISRYLCSECR